MDYPVDPELAAAAPLLRKIDLNDVAGTREVERQVVGLMPPYMPGRRLTVTDVSIPGPKGAPDVSARVYSSAGRTKALPGLLYLHSGGFVFGSLDSIDGPARMIADRVDVIVVTVDYRLAPEHPYPGALDDSYAALEWMASEAAVEHGIDPKRIAVLGESSGGGLAAALTLLARDRSGPRLTAQFLDAPTVDDRVNTPSMLTLHDTPVWQAVNSPIIWRYYLAGVAEPGGTDTPLYAAPARAEVKNLAGLPPAWVTSYEIDPTRDEGLNYARQLIQARVPTELHHYSGAFHMAHIVLGTAIGSRMHSDRIGAIHRMLHASQ